MLYVQMCSVNATELIRFPLFRTQALMSYLRACRTFTTTSLNASTPSSKVLPKSNTRTYHCYSHRINVPVRQFFCCPCEGSSDAVENIMDEVEKYMMTRLYKEVFCPETTDDEKKDLAIQKRIRSDTRAITRGRISKWQMTHLFIPLQSVALGDH